jgi:hypothetical protein
MGRTTLDVLQKGFGIPASAVTTPMPDHPGIIKLAAIRSSPQFEITPLSQARQLAGLEPDPFRGAPDRGGDFFTNVLPGILLGTNLAVAGGFGGRALGLAAGGASKAVSIFTAPPPRTGGRMAFQDGDSGFGFNDFFGGVGQALQGGIGQELLGIGTQALRGFLTPAQGTGRLPITMADTMPAVGGAVATVGRSFFNRFPNLAVSLQKLRNAGANVTRGSLWSLMKRFGPDFLVAGSILTAAAVSELAIAGPGRRRMNPGNIKALRKAHRRMKAFHNVCRTNDMMLGSRRGSKKKGFHSGATSVVNVK